MDLGFENNARGRGFEITGREWLSLFFHDLLRVLSTLAWNASEAQSFREEMCFNSVTKKIMLMMQQEQKN